MRERIIEQALVDRVKKAGGKAYKFSSPSNRGVPDRVCLLPGGRVVFVELKAPGKKPTKLQTLVMNQMIELGMEVCVIDSIEGVLELC